MCTLIYIMNTNPVQILFLLFRRYLRVCVLNSAGSVNKLHCMQESGALMWPRGCINPLLLIDPSRHFQMVRQQETNSYHGYELFNLCLRITDGGCRWHTVHRRGSTGPYAVSVAPPLHLYTSVIRTNSVGSHLRYDSLAALSLVGQL